MAGILQLKFLEKLVEGNIRALGPVRGEGVEGLVRHLQRQRLVPVHGHSVPVVCVTQHGVVAHQRCRRQLVRSMAGAGV